MRWKGEVWCNFTVQKSRYPPCFPPLKNVLFPGHNDMLTTGTDDPSLAGTWAIIKVLGHQQQWLAGGYDLELGLFRGGWHGGYLVDSGLFLRSVSSNAVLDSK